METQVTDCWIISLTYVIVFRVVGRPIVVTHGGWSFHEVAGIQGLKYESSFSAFFSENFDRLCFVQNRKERSNANKKLSPMQKVYES